MVLYWMQFQDKTPYSIMFGPDRCGVNSKIHFIIQFKNPVTGEVDEKHSKQSTESMDFFTDKKTHLFTLREFFFSFHKHWQTVQGQTVPLINECYVILKCNPSLPPQLFGLMVCTTLLWTRNHSSRGVFMKTSHHHSFHPRKLMTLKTGCQRAGTRGKSKGLILLTGVIISSVQDPRPRGCETRWLGRGRPSQNRRSWCSKAWWVDGWWTRVCPRSRCYNSWRLVWTLNKNSLNDWLCVYVHRDEEEDGEYEAPMIRMFSSCFFTCGLFSVLWHVPCFHFPMQQIQPVKKWAVGIGDPLWSRTPNTRGSGSPNLLRTQTMMWVQSCPVCCSKGWFQSACLQGKWSPRKIENPAYFEDDSPFTSFSSISAVGFELWTMSEGIMIDNVIVCGELVIANNYARDGWVLLAVTPILGTGV